eukprot:3808464-Amphidinium_carterae.2
MDVSVTNSKALRVKELTPETTTDHPTESPEEMIFNLSPLVSEEDCQLLSDLPTGWQQLTLWVDVAKHGAVRSRIVGKRFSWTDTGEDPDSSWAGTPDATCVRLLMPELAQSRDHVAVIIDAVSVFLQAESSEGCVVCPPKSVRKPGTLWRLLKALPGLRESSRLWQDHQAKHLETGGFRRGLVEPCTYMHVGEARDCKLENHGDDTFVVGSRKDVAWFRDWVQTQWVCNVGPLIGLGDQDAHE